MSKKIAAIILALTLMISLCSAFAVNENNTDGSMDNLDVFLVADKYLYELEDSTDEAVWVSSTKVEQIVPLYDTNNSLFAYYISFSPRGYAVVNNNLNNPVAIEFGVSESKPIEDLIQTPAARSGEAPHIVYINPEVSVLWSDLASVNTYSDSNSEDRLSAFYEQLSETSTDEKELHAQRRAAYLESAVVPASIYDDYGFYHVTNMPTASYNPGFLKSAVGITWAVMSDYNSIADNHCGATAATNIAIYLAKSVDSRIKKNGSIRDTFVDLHDRIGNGPTAAISSQLKAYVSTVTSQQRTLTARMLNNYTGIKTATDNDHPCALLLTGGILDWHWVVSVGYREYNTTTGKYVQIVTGWDSRADYFYLFNTNSISSSITEYSVS